MVNRAFDVVTVNGLVTAEPGDMVFCNDKGTFVYAGGTIWIPPNFGAK